MSGAGARRDPARTAAVLVPALVAAVLIPLLVRSAYRTVTTSTQGQSQPTVPRAARLPATPAHLLVVADPQGAPVSAVLLAPSPRGRGGAVVVLPLGTVTTGGDGQPVRLDGGAAATDQTALAANVEGLLGITLTSSTRVAAADLASLLARLPPADVTLVDDVRSVATDGTASVIVPAGRRSLGPPLAAQVLAARGDESELVRVDRAVALWRSLLAAPVTGPSTTATSAVASTGELDGVLATLAGGPTVTRSLTVTLASAPTDEVERFASDVTGMRLLMAQIVPAAVSPAESNLRFRVRNPSGDESVAYHVVGRLLAAGAAVVLVDDTAGSVPATSALTYADAALGPQLASVASSLGSIGGALTDERIDGIDATLTVGADVAAAARRVAPTTTGPATSTTTPSTTAPSTTAPSTTAGPPGPSTTKKSP